MNKKKIVWVTDLHLDHTAVPSRKRLMVSINKESPDILLIGGDTGLAPNISERLRSFEPYIKGHIYFVLGNHDFYYGSISQVRNEIRETVNKSNKLFFLDDIPYVEITDDVALVGNSSWADGRLGNYDQSPVMLNDYYLIDEFKELNKEQRLQKLKELGDHAASQLKGGLKKALSKYKKVLCLTHVPPFRESCWHEGEISNDDFLPHFACKGTGDVMRQTMELHPDSYLTALCGHTHSSGKAQILDNLEVITGSAEYGKPEIQQIFYI